MHNKWWVQRIRNWTWARIAIGLVEDKHTC